MKKLSLAAVPLVAAALLVAAWFEPTRSVRGWVRGEPFYQSRPASYWGERLVGVDPAAQASASETLRAGAAAAEPVLSHLMSAERPELRWRAAELIGQIGPPAVGAAPALVKLLDDPDPFVRGVAARALGAIEADQPEVIRAMIAKLATDDRDQVIRPLSRFKASAREAVPALIEIARTPTDVPNRRWEAIRTLGKIGPDSKPAVPVLIAGLKDANDLVREHSAESLGEIGAVEAVPHLIDVLNDPYGKVRRDAARSLGQLGPAAKSALPAIEKLLTDKEAMVRDAAATALRRIDPERK